MRFERMTIALKGRYKPHQTALTSLKTVTYRYKKAGNSQIKLDEWKENGKNTSLSMLKKYVRVSGKTSKLRPFLGDYRPKKIILPLLLLSFFRANLKSQYNMQKI